MKTIYASSPKQALHKAITQLTSKEEYYAKNSCIADSRNGKVLKFTTPVTTVYKNPRNRWLLSKARQCNHLFHFMEALWMLAGRNDTAFPCQFVKSLINYSDNGETFNGAYGHRWRNYFHHDQIISVVKELGKNPTSRRQVITMWDGEFDLNPAEETVDVPCNLNIVFAINGVELDMTVFNRSNDIIWGAYGANYVHFGYLQEIIAAALKVHVGKYYQVSNDFHAYEKVLNKLLDKGFLEEGGVKQEAEEYYKLELVGNTAEERITLFLEECEKFVKEFDGIKSIMLDDFNRHQYQNNFFFNVAIPAANFFYNIKENEYSLGDAFNSIQGIKDENFKDALYEQLICISKRKKQ